MQFGERTNPANILDEFFNQTDSLIHSKVMDLDNPNNAKENICKEANFRNTERN